MKKFRNWLGTITAIALVLTVVLMVPATSILKQRKSGFRPLNDETLGQISATRNGIDQNGLSSRDAPLPPHIHGSEDAPSEYAKSAHTSTANPNRPASLTRTLTCEDLLREFEPGTNPLENAYWNLLGRGMKLQESLSWAAGAADNGQTALDIGLIALSNGDIEEARDYLRAALDANIRSGDLSLRQLICSRLACAEDDPEVAAALLAASCTAARPIDEEFLPGYVQDALVLSILTGSHELAEHYYAQWDALEPGEKPIVNFHLERGGSALVVSWLEEHHPDFYETATRWDPMQKREEDGVKRVG